MQPAAIKTFNNGRNQAGHGALGPVSRTIRLFPNNWAEKFSPTVKNWRMGYYDKKELYGGINQSSSIVTGSLGLGRVVTCCKWSHHECLTVNCSPPKNVSESICYVHDDENGKPFWSVWWQGALSTCPATGHWFPSTCQSLKVTSTIKFSLGDKSKVRPDTETDAKYTTHLLTGTGARNLTRFLCSHPFTSPRRYLV